MSADDDGLTAILAGVAALDPSSRLAAVRGLIAEAANLAAYLPKPWAGELCVALFDAGEVGEFLDALLHAHDDPS
jgi:hypothetical protein